MRSRTRSGECDCLNPNLCPHAFKWTSAVKMATFTVISVTRIPAENPSVKVVMFGEEEPIEEMSEGHNFNEAIIAAVKKIMNFTENVYVRSIRPMETAKLAIVTIEGENDRAVGEAVNHDGDKALVLAIVNARKNMMEKRVN